MPPRAPSKRPPTQQRQQAPRRSYREQIESAEVRRSRKAAILQLRMGRLAHVIGISSGLALALTALIAYGIVKWEPLSTAPDWFVTFKWIVPLVAGVVVAAVGIAMKWEPYLADREQPHFIMSIFALAVPALVLALIALDELGYLAVGRPTWLYPASLMGISLTLISLAMTWEGTSSRRTISIAAALFPLALLFVPVMFQFTDDELAGILPMAYLGSAVSVQLSGSMLHIIASSTSVQQREVLRASDSKLKEQIQDLEKRRHALAYREEALRAKESDLEAYEKRLAEELSSIEETKGQITAAEAELDIKLRQAREERERLAKQTSEVEDQRDGFSLRQSDIDAQRAELQKRVSALNARDATISARERDANRLLLDAQAKERDINGRAAEILAEETAIAATRKELDLLQASLAEREKGIKIGESELDLKKLEVSMVKDQLTSVSAQKVSIESLERELLKKQEALSAKEIVLKTSEDELKKRSEKAERLIARADKEMNQLVEKETSVIAREKSVSDKEAGLKAALEGLNTQLEEMSRAKASFSEKEKQFQDFTTTTRTKLSSLSAQEEEITKKMAALEKREAKIKELDQGLKSEKERMNSKLRELLEKEKDLEAKEAEVGLKQAELKAMERGLMESVDEVEEVREELPDEEAEEREKALQFREQKLAQKEQELKSRYYEREKELAKKELSLRAHVSKDIEDMEEAIEEEVAEEKVKTGIERLDDLLMGGMPFGSNVLFVGPPFIGKEVAMMLFLAEGLKKGVPVIIITTSHPPGEISKDIAPILPTFMEFQQLGMVRWIDASGMPVEQGANGSVVRLAGPADFEGIIKAVDGFAKDFEKHRHPYFRVAYLSLSLSLTQADEKVGFQFVQSLTGRFKQARAVAAFAVERGMHTEQQLEAIQHHMTGSLQFKTEKQKMLLSVQGIGDVQTRAWVEYRHTNKALMIGAFSLERIR